MSLAVLAAGVWLPTTAFAQLAPSGGGVSLSDSHDWLGTDQFTSTVKVYQTTTHTGNNWIGLSHDGTVAIISSATMLAGSIVFTPSTASVSELAVFQNTVSVQSDGFYCWDNSTTNANGTCDTGLRRVAAGVAGTRSADWFQQAAARSMLAADYTNATTTFSNTALSITVVSGRKYSFSGALFLTESTAADGVKIDFNGGSAAATNFIAHCVLTNDTGAGVTQVTATSAALATVISANATTTANVHLYMCDGSFEPSGAGTFIIRAAQVAHTTGTLTVKRGSFIQVEDMP